MLRRDVYKRQMMKRVTGTGCMLSGLICAFVAADCDDKYGADVYKRQAMCMEA